MLKWTFLLAVLLGAVIVLAMAMISLPDPRTIVLAKPLAGSIWVTEQITANQLADIKAKGFRAIVDLRPDGEVVGQPASADLARAVQADGLAFSYIPVPHGEIPTAAVDALGRSLAQPAGPVLLYCRSGRRAARTWALAEASRPGGLDASAIEAAVRTVDQPVDDLSKQIAARIASRPVTH